MSDNSLVSIGVPVYNGENFLEETLDCLLGQTFSDFQLVISDNASSDGTQGICEDYAARDSRIRYHRLDENIGAGPNHNRVLELSNSPYFKWAAHDDLYEPTYLEGCVAVLDNDPSVVLVHSDTILIDTNGTPLPFDTDKQLYTDPETGRNLVREPTDVATSDAPNERFQDVLHKIIWCTDMYGLIRRDQIRKTTLFRSYYGSDKVFLAEMALLGRFHHIDEILFKKRCHPSMSANMDASKRVEFMDTKSPSTSPYIQLFKGYMRAALRTGSLNFTERTRCLAERCAKNRIGPVLADRPAGLA